MAEVQEMEFTKHWTDPEDFPTHESDEEKVRADLQYLFDELKDFINHRLVAKLNGLGGADIAVNDDASETLDSRLSDIALALQNLHQEIVDVTLGQVPDGSITRDKLDSWCIVPNKVSTLETSTYDDSDLSEPRWVEVIQPDGWTYRPVIRCGYHSVAGTTLQRIYFEAVVKFPQTYDPNFFITLDFEENAPSAVREALMRPWVSAKATLAYDYRIDVEPTDSVYRFKITIPEGFYETKGEDGIIEGQTNVLPMETAWLYFGMLIA